MADGEYSKIDGWWKKTWTNQSKLDDLGVPTFMETSKWKSPPTVVEKPKIDVKFYWLLSPRRNAQEKHVEPQIPLLDSMLEPHNEIVLIGFLWLISSSEILWHTNHVYHW